MDWCLDEKGNMRGIPNSHEDKGFCPECNEPLIPKLGRIKEPHWAHFPSSHCTYNGTYPTNCWHHLMQLKFWLGGWKREEWIGGLRADLVKGNMIIELQHSPITPMEIKGRSDNARNHGFRIDWIFDRTEDWKKEILYRAGPDVLREKETYHKEDPLIDPDGIPTCGNIFFDLDADYTTLHKIRSIQVDTRYSISHRTGKHRHMVSRLYRTEEFKYGQQYSKKLLVLERRFDSDPQELKQYLNRVYFNIKV